MLSDLFCFTIDSDSGQITFNVLPYQGKLPINFLVHCSSWRTIMKFKGQCGCQNRMGLSKFQALNKAVWALVSTV